MTRLTDKQDAYGHAIYDSYLGKGGYEIDERDDGFVGGVRDAGTYLAAYDEWPPIEREAMEIVKGRILDIGCGAGRHALYLQEKGLDVLGIDVSPLAIKVCKLRGLTQAREMSITQLSRKLGTFDTLLMMGNNFGLFGSFKRAKWLLRRFCGMTSDQARIIAQSSDPYATDEPCHLAYHELNRKRGRMSGQIRLRVRYKTYATPWFDYFLVSRNEMAEIVSGTRWRVGHFAESDGPYYIGVIEKKLPSAR